MPQAPEVIEQSPDNVGFRSDGSGRPADGYDEAADIWSLGITAMEVRPLLQRAGRCRLAAVCVANDGSVWFKQRAPVLSSDSRFQCRLEGASGAIRSTQLSHSAWRSPFCGLLICESGGPPLNSTPPLDPSSAPCLRLLQLASGEPPRVNVASFRLLFMIVRDDPPQLEGSQWSTDFKDFVWQCLRKVGRGWHVKRRRMCRAAQGPSACRAWHVLPPLRARCCCCSACKPARLCACLPSLAGPRGVLLCSSPALSIASSTSHSVLSLIFTESCLLPPSAPPPACGQDPKARPSALDLLEHPFVTAAGTAPAELAQRVAAFQQRRPALLERQQQQLSGAGGYGTWGGGTVPRWDFAAPAAAPPAAGTGTVVATSSTARPATAPPPGDLGGTVRGPGGAAAADAAAAAAGPEFPGGGTVARRYTDTVVGPPAAAAAGADFSGTVQVQPGGGGSGKLAAAPPARLVIPNDPTQPDRPSGAVHLTRTGSTTGGDGGASKQLLTAGLQAVAGSAGAPPAAAAAADTAAAALSQLEAARPGAVRDALTELLTQLSLTGSPSLAGLKGTAEALFGASEDGGSASGGGGHLGDAPDLGPLGRFLMSRWREAVARERVQLSQQWQTS